MTAFCHADGPPVNAVSFAARKLYGEIQFRARNEHGCTRCYVATLAAKFDVSRRWVHALLNQLEEAGWIQRYTEPGQRTYIRPVVDAVASDVVPAPPAKPIKQVRRKSSRVFSDAEREAARQRMYRMHAERRTKGSGV